MRPCFGAAVLVLLFTCCGSIRSSRVDSPLGRLLKELAVKQNELVGGPETVFREFINGEKGGSQSRQMAVQEGHANRQFEAQDPMAGKLCCCIYKYELGDIIENCQIMGLHQRQNEFGHYRFLALQTHVFPPKGVCPLKNHDMPGLLVQPAVDDHQVYCGAPVVTCEKMMEKFISFQLHVANSLLMLEYDQTPEQRKSSVRSVFIYLYRMNFLSVRMLDAEPRCEKARDSRKAVLDTAKKVNPCGARYIKVLLRLIALETDRLPGDVDKDITQAVDDTLMCYDGIERGYTFKDNTPFKDPESQVTRRVEEIEVDVDPMVQWKIKRNRLAALSEENQFLAKGMEHFQQAQQKTVEKITMYLKKTGLTPNEKQAVIEKTFAEVRNERRWYLYQLKMEWKARGEEAQRLPHQGSVRRPVPGKWHNGHLVSRTMPHLPPQQHGQHTESQAFPHPHVPSSSMTLQRMPTQGGGGGSASAHRSRQTSGPHAQAGSMRGLPKSPQQQGLPFLSTALYGPSVPGGMPLQRRSTSRRHKD